MNKRRTKIVLYVNVLTNRMGLRGYNYTEDEAFEIVREAHPAHIRYHIRTQNREFRDDIEAEKAAMGYVQQVKLYKKKVADKTYV